MKRWTKLKRDSYPMIALDIFQTSVRLWHLNSNDLYTCGESGLSLHGNLSDNHCHRSDTGCPYYYQSCTRKYTAPFPPKTHTHTHTLSLSLSLSLSITHTHTLSLSLSDTHPHSITHTHTLSLSLSHTHTLSLSLSHCAVSVYALLLLFKTSQIDRYVWSLQIFFLIW